MMNPLDRLLLWREEAKFKKISDGFEHQPATPELVAKRFRQLFNLHGIQTAEIPEVDGYENITLHDLNADDRLIQKLTPELLHKTANRFGIRIEWLRSGEPTLYDNRHWYKDGLKSFFEDLKEINFEETYDPFFIITTHEKLDVHRQEYQPFLLALRSRQTAIGEKDLYRYYIESEWHWHHPPCRLQAKALATQYYKLTKRMITIYTTDQITFQRIALGYIPPNDNLAPNHKISFEEYGALKLNHIEPYEKEEFDAVVETMKEYEIDEISYEYIKVPSDNASSITPKRKPGRRPDERKREIKQRYLEKYEKKIFRREISADQAARDYFLELSESERVLLFQSPAKYAAMIYEEAEIRAVRTLSEYYAKAGK